MLSSSEYSRYNALQRELSKVQVFGARDYPKEVIEGWLKDEVAELKEKEKQSE